MFMCRGSQLRRSCHTRSILFLVCSYNVPIMLLYCFYIVFVVFLKCFYTGSKMFVHCFSAFSPMFLKWCYDASFVFLYWFFAACTLLLYCFCHVSILFLHVPWNGYLVFAWRLCVVCTQIVFGENWTGDQKRPAWPQQPNLYLEPKWLRWLKHFSPATCALSDIMKWCAVIHDQWAV